MKLEFIDPADLPTNACHHQNVDYLYSRDDGQTSMRYDGLYFYGFGRSHTPEMSIPRHLSPPEAFSHFTFHHAQCNDCHTDITERVTLT